MKEERVGGREGGKEKKKETERYMRENVGCTLPSGREAGFQLRAPSRCPGCALLLTSAYSGNTPALSAVELHLPLLPPTSWDFSFLLMSLYFSHKVAECKSRTYITSWDFWCLVEGQDTKETVYDSVYFCTKSFIRDQDSYTFILRYSFLSPSKLMVLSSQ